VIASDDRGGLAQRADLAEDRFAVVEGGHLSLARLGEVNFDLPFTRQTGHGFFPPRDRHLPAVDFPKVFKFEGGAETFAELGINRLAAGDGWPVSFRGADELDAINHRLGFIGGVRGGGQDECKKNRQRLHIALCMKDGRSKGAGYLNRSAIFDLGLAAPAIAHLPVAGTCPTH